MKGKHKIVVSTKRLKYEFELHRNLTIIRGDSATGKTTLVDGQRGQHRRFGIDEQRCSVFFRQIGQADVLDE